MSAALDRLAPLSTTGVGSLPFADPAEAVAHVMGAYELPFCPQLPRLDGDMISEWLGSDLGRCGWTRDRDRERPAAWDAFVARVGAGGPGPGLVKLQVTGPVTLAMALEHAAGRGGAGPDVVALAREIAVWLAANTAGQVRRLADLDLPAVVVVDEPGLRHAGVAAAEADLWDPLRAVAPAWGLHVCGHVPWRLVGVLEVDLLSIDVAAQGLDVEARAALRMLLRCGARVAWGVLDPVAPAAASEVSGLVAACLAAMAGEGLSLSRVAQLSLLTPSCGTGRLSRRRERGVVAALVDARTAARAAVQAITVPAATPI